MVESLWRHQKQLGDNTMIDYTEVIELGFKRLEDTCEDQVFFDKYGYNYFIVELRADKNIYFDWCSISRKVCLIRVSSEGIVENRLYINDLSVLKPLVKFFTESNPDSEVHLDSLYAF